MTTTPRPFLVAPFQHAFGEHEHGHQGHDAECCRAQGNDGWPKGFNRGFCCCFHCFGLYLLRPSCLFHHPRRAGEGCFACFLVALAAQVFSLGKSNKLFFVRGVWAQVFFKQFDLRADSPGRRAANALRAALVNPLAHLLFQSMAPRERAS